MILRDFADGFDRDPLDYTSLSNKKWKDSTRALMEQPTRMSRYFGGILDHHLNGFPVDAEAVAQIVARYTDHSHRQMYRKVTETMQGIAFQHPSVASYLNDLNFHAINQEMTQYWRRLIDTDNHAPDYIDLTVMQARLGVRALQLVENRAFYYSRTLQQTPEPTEDNLIVDGSFAGQITEVEAAMATLEMIKQHSAEDKAAFVVVPSPNGYDNGVHSGVSSDMLFFDINEDQVVGIQTKTRLRGKGKYDQERITFIDGVKDLGNVVPPSLTKDPERVKPHPGLLAADFILNNEALQRGSRYSRIEGLEDMFGQIRHAKEVAFTLSPYLDYPERVQRAAERIGSRILFALYEEETEPDMPSDSE